MNLKHGSTPWVFIFLLQWLWAGCALAQLPDAVQRVKPSVVLDGTYKDTDNPRFRFVGTGFVVGDGLRVVTNAHVTKAPKVRVRMHRPWWCRYGWQASSWGNYETVPISTEADRDRKTQTTIPVSRSPDSCESP